MAKPNPSELDKAIQQARIERVKDRGMEVSGDDEQQVISCKTRTIRTLAGALAAADVDTKVWEVERWVANKWDMGMKLKSVEVDKEAGVENRNENPAALELWQVKVWLRRKTAEKTSLEGLLAELKKASPKVPKLKRIKRPKGKPRRALEVCIMDPHLGLECFRPGSDHSWSLDECEHYFSWAIEGLLDLAAPYAPFDEVVWVFGNDYLHADNVFHTTTAGTPQPEAVSWHTTVDRGVALAIASANRLKEVGPLKVIQISGNHDRQSTYLIGHVLNARFWRDKNVEVEVNPSPYKFWRYGVNLVGLDHGHSKKTEALAALMANECADVWGETRYREWHLGDQHRKGSGRPTIMTEQGVGVEFLTGLTPGNEWHKIKTFNWSPRGAVAYVWNHDRGPEARLHVNLDSYSGKPMGEG